MSLEIINKPILATIQDMGRFSYSNIGVSNSGVMDEYAYLYVNKILGNDYGTNALEISFSNVQFKVNDSTQIALTGAKCEFFINDVLMNTWETYNIKNGDILKVGRIIEGTRVYLAVSGGFDIKKEFGSNSTTIKEKLGGIDGDKLKKGDILPFKSSQPTYKKRLHKEYIPKYSDELILRVILCSQEDNFSQEEKDKFFSSTYTITNDFNRMGCKLNGEVIKSDINGIISEGIAFGAIQIPSDGQPIILLKERQTIGGYPKIGTVFSLDCFNLAQAKPNSKIRFTPISIEEAQEKLRAFYHYFR
ncbi:biotin-dependent carboxyltransferase family protein [Arcobacter sp. F2176]|uniref:5-oxoprolinase subunit C family protein n=1 Tax=Arcobacter sp. F2176 TaxID=2044511 RepID=UPI00100A55B3|nr:biotin-dependent carboxyltransferase family protein [Arcobacter sp. F2176]RXJ81973.1 urea amidolyase [Arcobacter sp. F2176]